MSCRRTWLASLRPHAVCVTLALAVCVTFAHAADVPPTETPAPGATAGWTGKRLYRVAWTSTPSPVPMLALHAWTITITDAAGAPVDDARVTVLGGMPAHNHGLPTTPAVRGLGGGRYLVEGLKFHMPGAWVVAFRIKAAAGTDAVSFPFELP